MNQNVSHPTESQLVDAYFAGFRTHGDPEMLEEIGIPTTPDSFQVHVAAGEEIGTILSRDGTPVSPETVKKIAAFCADCLDDVIAGESCEHIMVDARGKITSRYPRN